MQKQTFKPWELALMLALCLAFVTGLWAQGTQAELSSKDDRWIRLMLKTVDGKLLLSVKNPVEQPLVFADGLPVTSKKGHGYGTQSIRYMTEKLGGKCQFSIQNDLFILRAII